MLQSRALPYFIKVTAFGLILFTLYAIGLGYLLGFFFPDANSQQQIYDFALFFSLPAGLFFGVLEAILQLVKKKMVFSLAIKRLSIYWLCYVLILYIANNIYFALYATS